MFRNLAILVVVLSLAGCIAQSDIQADYMAQESDCRNHAESYLDTADEDADISDTAYRIGASFSRCMNQSGWKVSIPRPPQKAAAPAAAAQNQKGAPVAAAPIVASRMQAPAAAPSANTSYYPRTASPAPSMRPGMPTSGMSTYQPARPQGVIEPDYGSGAGRNY